MKLTTFAALAAVTVAVAGGAYWAAQQRDAHIADPWQRQALYPGLLERLNDVTSLRIATQADGPLTMTKSGDAWTLAEANGYAVDFAKIRQTLVELSSMETLEPKTQKPENYAALRVEDVDVPAGKTSGSTRVTAKAGDAVLADMLVGLTRPADVGAGVFVRKAGENQVWLATGSYQPNPKALQWLDRNVVNVDSRRIAEVVVSHPDGDTYKVAKPEMGSEDMAYASPVPDGQSPKPVHEMNNMASVTDFLIFEEVVPASQIKWDAPQVVSTYRTYDGVLVTITAMKADDNKTWVQVAASVAPRTDGIDAYVAENKGKDSMAGRIADQFIAADAVSGAVDAINKRVGGWAYRLTDYKSGKVMQRSADMLQEAGKEASKAN
jgi:hypothetical protein